MKLLISGASSYVGARLYLDLRPAFSVTGTYAHTRLSEDFVHMDITDPEEIHDTIIRHKPDIIIHVAANATTRWCADHPEEARVLNQSATENIRTEADAIGAHIIYMSSYAAIQPEDVYGSTKYESEQTVKQSKHGYLILRPSFILGFSPNTKNDRPFNRLLRNLDQGEPARYDTSWKFQPTYVGHLSEVIRTAITRNIWNETIHVTVPELATRYSTARDILSPFGVEVTPIDHKSTIPVLQNDLSGLKRLKLPQYTYARMIETIINEIRNRERFILDV